MSVDRDWPQRQFSSFHELGPIRWHVQQRGAGTNLLLLHGTGAASGSWMGITELLETEFHMLAPDLPGHGLSSMVDNHESSLPGYAGLLSALLTHLQFNPEVVVGHSAGAAILAWMCLEGLIAPRLFISINGAFLPFGNSAAPVFSKAAKMLANSSLMPHVVAMHSLHRRSVERMLEQTGSRPSPAMTRQYRQLIASPKHVRGTLRMMANWNLRPLAARLGDIDTTTHIVVCDNDRTVPPAQGERVAAAIPRATLHRLPGLGHLGHEEAPGDVATLLRAIIADG